MKAEIISIGTELLLGEITDTNAAYLASQLPLLGIDLHFISTVGDNKQRLIETLNHAWQRSDIIITTGGLGPTEDDITREAIAEFFQEPITIDQSLVNQFKELFKRFNMDMPESNIKQASIIPSAGVIANPRGTAPGWWVERAEHVIIAMPGPPGEMQQMWSNVVAPQLQKKYCDAIIYSKTLKTFSLSEAKVGELTRTYLLAKNPTVGIYAKPDGIHLRITAKAETLGSAEELVNKAAGEIHEILGKYIWGSDSDTLEGIIANLLITNNMNLAVIEAGTGGILANTITNIPESSKFFRYGIVINRDDLKREYGINDDIIEQYGMVSQEVACKMASAIKAKYETSFGIGLIGVTEPDELNNKLGTIVIGIENNAGKHGFKKIYPGTRMQVKQRAAIAALYELKNILTEETKCT
ncbi:MAG: competence/damage-inducible protein A [Chloroflexi bacterium]|nr:competence/damage-inducible protein A [Chloroflexota bacterium]